MIYLDHNATTPIDKEVADAMLPFIHENYGNPSSSYKIGTASKKAVETARKQVAELISCSPDEIIFTSGGSESNNTAIKGTAFTYKNRGNHIITSVIEHPSVLNPCGFLEKSGYQVTCLPVDKYGIINTDELKKNITDKTILVTIMHSNNETGTLQPVREISDICREHGALFHTDASQSAGKVNIDVREFGVDFLTIAGHKLYAPKGIGALYIKKSIEIEPLIHGAGQENGHRAGTENVVFSVALGKACEIAKKYAQNNEIKSLTDYFYNQLKSFFGKKIRLNGHYDLKLPNTLNVSFPEFHGYEIIEKLQDIAASTGSACHSGQTAMSPVLKAMGLTEKEGRGALRFSLGRYTTENEINYVLDKLKNIFDKSN